MRFRLNKALTLLTFCFLALGGCAPDLLPPTWHTGVPGAFQGTSSVFKETLVFSPDGGFKHQVFNGNQQIHSESGTWFVPHGDYSIELRPFTQFYDPMKRQFTTTGKQFSVYYYSPLPDGRGSFNMISADAEYAFRLIRQLPAESQQNKGKGSDPHFATSAEITS